MNKNEKNVFINLFCCFYINWDSFILISFKLES
jgi:hypothetical protein